MDNPLTIEDLLVDQTHRLKIFEPDNLIERIVNLLIQKQIGVSKKLQAIEKMHHNLAAKPKCIAVTATFPPFSAYHS